MQKLNFKGAEHFNPTVSKYCIKYGWDILLIGVNENNCFNKSEFVLINSKVIVNEECYFCKTEYSICLVNTKLRGCVILGNERTLQQKTQHIKTVDHH